MRQADEIHEQLNIPVVLADGSLTNLDKTYEFLGELLDEKDTAKKRAEYCKDTVTIYRKNPRRLKRVSVSAFTMLREQKVYRLIPRDRIIQRY